MKIDDIGYNHRHDKTFFVDRPHGCDNWLLLLIRTEADFSVNLQPQHIPANCFVLFEPHCPHTYRTFKNEYADDWIHFFPSTEELELMNRLQLPRNQIIPMQDVTDLSVLVRGMCFEFYSPNPYRFESIDQYFRLLIYKLTERACLKQAATNFTKNTYFEELLWMRESIYRNPEQDWLIDTMAAGMTISRSRLQHLYAEIFGVCITQDIITARMNLACQLLRNTSQPVHEIAKRCGYKQAAYFMRCFKEKTGMTPSFYRSSNYPVKITD